MEEFKGNNGKWEVGKDEMTVISDSSKNIPTDTGHDDIQYYGGYLIAESIYNKEDAKLIAAAPMLLEALQKSSDLIKWLLENGNFSDIETSYNSAMNQINENEETITKALGL